MSWQLCKLTKKYEVSKDGRVRNLQGKILSGGRKTSRGTSYLTVDVGGKKISIHRMIAATFVGCVEGLVVNHLNGNTMDNRADNLEVTTVLRNNRHAIEIGLKKTNPKQQKYAATKKSFSKMGERNPRAKLTERQAREIKYKFKHLSAKEVGSMFGVSEKMVGHIWRNERWSYV